MRLYLTPDACSLSPHIALREAGLPFEVEAVDLATKKTRAGADYRAVNPKGQVPALVLDDGQVLTEGAAMVQYIADRRPEAGLAPPAGTWARYRLQEQLNYVASELHKGFGPLFHAGPEVTRQGARDALAKRFDYLSERLAAQPYLVGDGFTVADGYLFTILRWATLYTSMKVDLERWPVLTAFLARVAERPAVQAALAAEAALR